MRTHKQSAPTDLTEVHMPEKLKRVCMHVLMPIDIDTRVKREASALAEQGYEVTIIDLADAGVSSFGQTHKGIQVKHLPVSHDFNTTRFKRWALLRAFALFIRAVLSLLRTPTDIYHAHDFQALPATYVAARLRHKPLIYDAHELPLSDPAFRVRWLRGSLRLLLRHSIPRCAGVISVSQPIIEELQRTYHASTVALVRNMPWYQSVERSKKFHQHLKLAPDTRVLLYQGYLSQDRGLDLLVRSARFLQAGSVIVLMGPALSEVREELEALIASEGVAERVKILPAVPYTELLAWTAAADVGLCLFRPDYSLNIRWCLPNKLFEYIMAGLPVLASPLDAVRAILEDQQIGRIVTDLTPAGVAAAMNSLLDDPQALAKMRTRALELAHQSFCWESERTHLLELYARLESRGSSGIHSQSSGQ